METNASNRAAESAAPPPPAEFVTITEAARRLGIDKSVVSRQANKFDVVKNERGQIDFGDYVAKRGDGLNPSMARGPEGIAMGGQGYGAPGHGSGADAPSGNGGAQRRNSALVQASTALKAIQAEDARLDLEERKGLLIRRADVADQLIQVSRALRDELIGLPNRVAAELAALNDPDAVRLLLEERLETALAALSVRFQRIAGES